MTQPERPAERPAEPRGVREGRQRAKERVRAVQRAAEAIGEDGYVRMTRRGPVHLQSLTFHKEGEVEWVEAHLGGQTEGGDPHYRIFNPPTLVEDPDGDVQLTTGTYREDPLAAVAEVIAQYGGAQDMRRERRRA
jgi:hypothetical protein